MQNQKTIGDAFYALTEKKISNSEQVTKLVEKWNQSALFNSKKYPLNSTDKRILARLLENQSKELVNIINGVNSSTPLLKETSTTSNLATINTIGFPVVVKAWKKQIAPELVSVQPLSLPLSYVFYLDYKLNDTRGRYTTGDSALGNPFGKSIEDGANVSLASAFYNLASSYADYIVSGSGFVVEATGSGSASWADVKYYPALSGATVYYYAIPTSSFTSSDCSGLFDQKRLMQVSIVTGSTTNRVNYPIFNKISGTNLVFYTTSSLTTESALTCSWVCNGQVTCSSGLEGYVVTNESDLASPTPSPTIPEIGIEFQKKAVEAENKKLRASWTNEVAQDMEAFLGYNAEQLMSNLLADMIAFELDQQVIEQLYSMARKSGIVGVWSFVPGRYVTDYSTGATRDSTGYDNTHSWLQTLFLIVNQVSSEIERRTRTAGANFLVCNTRIGALIKTIPGFVPNTGNIAGSSEFQVGAAKLLGTMNSEYKVYIDPTVPETEILVGYKGANPIDSGLIVAPYVTALIFETVRRYTDFNPTKGIMTRNAIVPIRNDFYGIVQVRDIPNM